MSRTDARNVLRAPCWSAVFLSLGRPFPNRAGVAMGPIRSRPAAGRRRTAHAGTRSGTSSSAPRSPTLPDDFIDYACGTNGGPPSTPLIGFADFRRCRPEPSGLREVYFRYDDELEYWAKANDLAAQMEQYIGTKTYGFPIIASVLIGEAAVVHGIRIVTDPRDPTGDRDEAYLLRNFLNARFGRDGWQCEDLPRGAGRDAGRRHLHQAALPARRSSGTRGAAGDAPFAQARPEPIRSAFRQGDRQPVRKRCSLRTGAIE